MNSNGEFRDYVYNVIAAFFAVLFLCIVFVYVRSAVEIQESIYQRCLKQNPAPQRC